MHRALVVLAVAVLPALAARAGTIGQPATVPAGVLDMPSADQVWLAVRMVKGAPAEERPAATVLDWYPTAGGFRLTGGIADTRDAGRRAGGFVPYLGIGWQGAVLDDAVLVGLDFGAVLRGRPDLRVVDAPEPAVREPGITHSTAAALAIEPVVSLTFSYRF